MCWVKRRKMKKNEENLDMFFYILFEVFFRQFSGVCSLHAAVLTLMIYLYINVYFLENASSVATRLFKELGHEAAVS